MYNGLIKKYQKYLPVSAKTPVITLNEGNTPLIKSDYLGKLVGGKTEVYLKYEGLNPTGSFKDRGMTLAVSKAVEKGASAIICASTGNTSASAAAYAARAKIKCFVLVPHQDITLGKLAQALIHGAKVIAIDGNFDEALTLVKKITAEHKITLVNSINPFRLEGQKTAAFEICDELGEAPAFNILPIGNAGNIAAYWQGYKEYKNDGKINRLPAMIGFQAEGAAPIVRNKIVKNPKTIASAIKIGNPASWEKAIKARDESNGIIDMVNDQEILAAYKLLAEKEGVFVETASAVSVAGMLKIAKKGFFENRSAKKPCKIVCILTGHGLKDPGITLKLIKTPRPIPATEKAILRKMMA